MIRSINRAVVIGSGTMGGGLAALIANAGIPVLLLDVAPNKLTPEEEKRGLTLASPSVRNRIVNAGLDAVKKARPPALFTAEHAERISVGNLEDDFSRIGEADWILEVVVERLDIKQQLMARIEAVRKPGSIVSSNTSGIPIGQIASGRSEDFRAHFLGTHFFNPPRYLKLLEVIPTSDTLPEVIRFMIDFAERELGKGVVLCKDRPNFIANRLGAFGGATELNVALESGFRIEEVDAITGPVIGRPKTATFRLGDLVGIDIMNHVAENLYPAVPEDEQREALRLPEIVRTLVGKGWLGNKTGQGYYKSVATAKGREFWVLDLQTLEYKAPAPVESETLKQAEGMRSLAERLRFLVSRDDKVGKYLWTVLSRSAAYASLRVPEIADDIVSLDYAMKWGYGHQMGPFEIWDALGVREAAARMERDGVTVAPWVKKMLAGGRETFYQRAPGKNLYYSVIDGDYRPIPTRPEVIVIQDLKAKGKELRSNKSASLIDMGDGVLLLEFHTKANALDFDLVDMMAEGVRETEASCLGMVIGNQGEHFCAGANLNILSDPEQVGRLLSLQETIQAVRFCQRPVVAAPFGVAIGGGTEVCMACSRIVAAADVVMGQVEAGVGVLPGAGGCKELVRRIVSPYMKTLPNGDPLLLLQRVFEFIAMGKTAMGADEARQMGFLGPSDRTVMNRDLLLHEAKREVLHMAACGYRAPAKTKSVYAVGERGIAALKWALQGFVEGGYISEHDAKIGEHIANVICGGPLTSPQWVDEKYIMDLEGQAFQALSREPKTQARMQHMLRTGKVLRN